MTKSAWHVCSPIWGTTFPNLTRISVLQLIWVSSHGPQASLVFPYIIPLLPDVFKMSELNDNSELQKYSSAVLYVLSAVDLAPEFVNVILQSFVVAIKSSRVRLWLDPLWFRFLHVYSRGAFVFMRFPRWSYFSIATSWLSHQMASRRLWMFY